MTVSDTIEDSARTGYEAYAEALGINRAQGSKGWPDLPEDRRRAWRRAARAILGEEES